MTAPQPTRHPSIFTVAADPAAVAAAVARGATLAIADPGLAARLGLPTPPLPPGRLRDAVVAEAAAAEVPEAAVMLTAVALLDASVSASGMLPAALAAVKSPPTVIVGSPEQTAAVLSAAEAVAASRPGRAG